MIDYLRCTKKTAFLSAVLWSRSRPESDFFAGFGAGAGEKAPSSGSSCVAYGYYGGKLATILIKLCHILKIYTQIERKNRYTFKKAKLFTLVLKTALCEIIFFNRSRSRSR